MKFFKFHVTGLERSSVISYGRWQVKRIDLSWKRNPLWSVLFWGLQVSHVRKVCSCSLSFSSSLRSHSIPFNDLSSTRTDKIVLSSPSRLSTCVTITARYEVWMNRRLLPAHAGDSSKPVSMKIKCLQLAAILILVIHSLLPSQCLVSKNTIPQM